MTIRPLVALLASVILSASSPARAAGGPPSAGACFLLYEVNVGETRRDPASSCELRVTPASTFKIPHALAALDAGVVAGPDARFHYDGRPVPFESWKRDHTLAAALGPDRERRYLKTFAYGNAAPGDDLTSFWLGKSLLISPEEQMQFLLRLYQDSLPVKREAMRAVREMLVQPPGRVVNAAGEHPFGDSWPEGTVLGAKTGSATDRSGLEVRWLVGHISRGDRSWIFVGCVTGRAGLQSDAAIDLAARALHEEGVL